MIAWSPPASGARRTSTGTGRGAALRRDRLADYLEARAGAPILLVGEAPGYRGARVSGLPFTSERQLTGSGPAEATATIVQRVLAELGATESVLLWNIVPTHPGTETTNRAPSRAEIAAGSAFAVELACGRRAIARRPDRRRDARARRTSGIRRTAARARSPRGSLL